MSLPISYISISCFFFIFWKSFKSLLNSSYSSFLCIGQYSKGNYVSKFLTGYSSNIIMVSIRKLPEPQNGSQRYSFPVLLAFLRIPLSNIHAAVSVSFSIPHLTNGLYPCLCSSSLDVPINISALSLLRLI